MGKLSDITIKKELRPCLVNGKVKALFHTWEEHSKLVAPALTVGGHSGGIIKGMFGIVEDETGQVLRVNPTSIKFLDNEIQEYSFEIPETFEEV